MRKNSSSPNFKKCIEIHIYIYIVVILTFKTKLSKIILCCKMSEIFLLEFF